MATFVLVPGSMCGGWLWQRLVPLLRAAGHAAHPVTLTGFGERVHLGGPEVNLETHVTDLVNLFHYEDVREAILVGHSYAGMVIAGAAERIPERIRHLVYLDAVVPLDGTSFFSTRSIDPPAHDEWREPVPFAERETREVFPDLAEEDVSWFYERMTQRLVKTLADPVRLGNPAVEAIPHSYIFCRKNWTWDEVDNPLPPDIHRVRNDAGWDFRELDADHVAMFTRPRELAGMLLDLA